ncbi:hypothetical protein JKF63_06193 [Porcisia hertigi]|uniref:Alkyl transferase n=1 Tax=Porcisia hertigi TaxID=2761500 RepID=A0A836IZF2_9TRYP|nr:hypothetical protein JKF63_06193 [Porcisia hertigi]
MGFNSIDDILAIRTACGTFGVTCLAMLVFAFLGQIVFVLVKLYALRGVPLAAVKTTTSTQHSIDHNVRHLGIIMDGNRRYGKRHSTATKGIDAAALRNMREVLCSSTEVIDTDSMTRPSFSLAERYNRFLELIQNTSLDGHRFGGQKLLEVATYCIEAHIDMLTVYAFSTDNWSRPPAEVDALMSLFLFFFSRVRQVALERHIFVRFISTEPCRLPTRVVELMRSVEKETRSLQPRRLVLNICVSYSGQSEVVAACNRLLARRLQESASPDAAEVVCTPVTKTELDREMLRSITQNEHEAEDAHVFGRNATVEPDLILRTSGEQRISNFLLYECAYSEFVFLQKAWPEVTRGDIIQALCDFARRDKRKGR